MNPDTQVSSSEVNDTARDAHALRRVKLLTADSFISYQLINPIFIKDQPRHQQQDHIIRITQTLCSWADVLALLKK